MGILGRIGRALAALLRRFGRLVLTFLEIVGLRSAAHRESAEQLMRFKQCYAEFRALLGANHDFLEDLTDVEQKLLHVEPVDPAFIKRKVVRLIASVHRMGASLNAISRDRYSALPGRLDAIGAVLQTRLAEAPTGREGSPELVLRLDQLGANGVASVGGKMAHLGEVRNNVGLPTPDGFAVTADFDAE
mgnify:FL=1